MSNDREAVLLALEEAAQEVTHKLALLREVLKADALNEMQALTESEYSTDALVRLSNTHQQLDEALTLNLDSFASFYPGEFEEDKEAEKSEEYELIGTIDGTYNGRWMIAVFAENASAVWPDGTAIYVRRGKE
jgi:hypothetical protein